MHHTETTDRPRNSLHESIEHWASELQALQKAFNRKRLLGWGLIVLGLVGGCLIAAALIQTAWISIPVIVAGVGAGTVLLIRNRSSRKQAVQQLATEISDTCEAESLAKSDVVEQLWNRPIKGAVAESVLSAVDPDTAAMLHLRGQGLEFFKNEDQADIASLNINVSSSGGTVNSVTVEGEKAVDRFSTMAVEYLDHAAYVESIAALATLQGIYTQMAPPVDEAVIKASVPDGHRLKKATLATHQVISSFDLEPEMEAVYEQMTKKHTQSLVQILLAQQQPDRGLSLEETGAAMEAVTATDQVFVGACIDYLGQLSTKSSMRNRINRSLARIPDRRALPHILNAFRLAAFFPEGIEAAVRLGKEVRPKLLEAFKTASTPTRFNTGLALGIIDADGVRSEMEQFLSTLTHPLERIACNYCLARAGSREALSDIVSLLDGSDEQAPHAAAIALEHLPDPIDEETFHRHLDHPNKLVRLRLVRKLGAQGAGTPALRSALIERFHDVEEMVRTAAADAIARVDGNHVYDQVLAKTKGGTLQSRVCAYRALGKLGNPDAVPVLKHALKITRNNDQRRTAIAALGQLRAVAALADVGRYLQNPQLSTTAYWAVLQIGLQDPEAALQVLQRQRDEPKALFMRALLGDEEAKAGYKGLLSANKDLEQLVAALEFAPALRDPDLEAPMHELITYRRHGNFPADRYVPYLALKGLVHIKLARLAGAES